MKLKLTRTFKADTYTIGKLFIDGVYFCDTLEDKVRNLPIEPKVYSQTAIPSGTYKVTLAMSPRFKRLLPRLHSVPYFEGILIHSGNKAEDSAGCILVGENKAKGMVLNSKIYETELIKRMTGQTDITIEII